MMLAHRGYTRSKKNESCYVFVVAEFLSLQAEQGLDSNDLIPLWIGCHLVMRAMNHLTRPFFKLQCLFGLHLNRSSVHLHRSTEILSGTSGLTSVTTFKRSSTTLSPDFLPASSISLTFTSASALASSSAFLFPCLCCSYHQQGIWGLVIRVQHCEPRLRIS
jgi:hypothetical protein